MSIEDKYLINEREYQKREHQEYIDFAFDISAFGKYIRNLILLKKINYDEIEKAKMELLKIRNKAKSKKFKINVIDEFLDYLYSLDGYYKDVDTSREGT